jgi:hypothetical protein
MTSDDLSENAEFFSLLTSSYKRLVGSSLAPADRESSWLYHEAPFAVVAHNIEPDPRFIYANKAAQICFEYSWNEFTALPSRLSAEAVERAERQRLLDAVSRNGFVTGYRGIRIAKSGRRFWIEDGVVWQLLGVDGTCRGQAAMFASWRDIGPFDVGA